MLNLDVLVDLRALSPIFSTIFSMGYKPLYTIFRWRLQSRLLDDAFTENAYGARELRFQVFRIHNAL